MLAETVAILVRPWFFLCKGKQNIFEELWPYSPFQEHTPLHWIHEGKMLLHWTDCSPAVMLLLSTPSGRAREGWSNGKICGLCDQALSTQALQDHAPVSFISEKSLPPQICPVPSLHLLSISFFNRHISLLLTNNQSDWFDSWYNQVCRKQDPFPGSEGMEDRLFFFSKKNHQSSQSEARVTSRADTRSMCALYMGPKRFRGLSQCYTCFLWLLANFTFSVEKEACLSFPDTKTYELSSTTEIEEKEASDNHSTPNVSLAPPEENMKFIGHHFFGKFSNSLFFTLYFIEV